MNQDQLLAACNRLLAIEREILDLVPVEQASWFMRKPGHVDCFIVANHLKEILEAMPELPKKPIYRTVIEAGIWRHYKGGHYQVLGIAAHSETDEKMVVYISLDGLRLPGPRMRVRPLSMWYDWVPVLPGSQNKIPRFTYIGSELFPEPEPELEPEPES